MNNNYIELTKKITLPFYLAIENFIFRNFFDIYTVLFILQCEAYNKPIKTILVLK